MTPFVSVPFKTETEHGISQIEGLAKFSAAGVVLEFEAKLLGLMTSGVKEVGIPTTQIESIEVKSGYFDSKFENLFTRSVRIQLNSLAGVSDLPVANGQIKLKITRANAEKARDGVARVQNAISARLTEQIETQAPKNLFDPENQDTQPLKELD